MPPREDGSSLERLLDEAHTFPEPVAAFANEVRLARDRGDVTGVAKRLFDLGMAVVRYAVAIGLAGAADETKSTPASLSDAIGKAYRLTDGRWCELARSLEVALREAHPTLARSLAFVRSAAANEMIAARNAFAHESATGQNAADSVLALLWSAREILRLDLRLVTSLEPPLSESRTRGTDPALAEALPQGVLADEAYVVADRSWLRATPWLPFVDDVLRLPDAPRGAGKPWRWIDPVTGERTESPALTRAVRAAFAIEDRAPRHPVDCPALVGRSAEVSLIERGLGEAGDGAIRAIVLQGSQGVGRSRLIAEAAAAAPGFGLNVSVVAFGSVERRRPLASLRIAFEASPEACLADARAAIEQATATEALSDRGRTEANLEAVEEAVVEASLVHGLLLAVDDAQWLDDMTLALLRLLAERASRGARGRLAVLLAVRTEPAQSKGLGKLLALAASAPGALGATLRPLSDEEAAALVQKVAPVSAKVVEHLVREARGVPFYLVQPLCVWADTGALAWRDGAWHPPTEELRQDGMESTVEPVMRAVPRIAQLVEERIESFFEADSRSEEAAQSLLACVAFHGIDLPRSRAERILDALGHDRALASRVAAVLVAARILERGPGGALRFAQPIVAHAVLEQTRSRDPSWWSDLCAETLAAMESGSESERDPWVLARGYQELGDAAKSDEWLLQAAADCLNHGLFERARDVGQDLARRATDWEVEARAQIITLKALLRSGSARAARDLLKIVPTPRNRRLELEFRLCRCAAELALGSLTSSDAEAVIAAADAQGDLPSRIEARRLASHLLRGARGRWLVSEALGLLGDAMDGMTLDTRYRLLALDLELVYETREGGIAALRDASMRARDAARRLRSKWAELDVRNDAAILEGDAGNVDRALADLVEVVREAGANHFGSLRRFALVNAAALELRVGRVDDARTHAAQAVEEARGAGDVRTLGAALSVRAEAEWRAGVASSAREAIDESIALKREAGESAAIALLRRADMHRFAAADVPARGDAEAALAEASRQGQLDHRALARLWLSLDDVRLAKDGAAAALARVVTELEAAKGQLRPATLLKLEEARQAIAGIGFGVDPTSGGS